MGLEVSFSALGRFFSPEGSIGVGFTEVLSNLREIRR